MENGSPQDDILKRLALAEVQVERSKVVMESLAGFCHALGQPAQVLLSSIELLKMDGVDTDTQKQVLDICYDAAMEIKNLLAQMKEKREYVAEAYRQNIDSVDNMILSLPEWKQNS